MSEEKAEEKEKTSFSPFKFLDVFGYQVKLNVDNNNKTHKTSCGAIVSLVYLAAFIWCFIQCLGSDVIGEEANFDKSLKAKPSTRRR